MGLFFLSRFFGLYPTLWICMGIAIAAVLVLSGHSGRRIANRPGFRRATQNQWPSP